MLHTASCSGVERTDGGRVFASAVLGVHGAVAQGKEMRKYNQSIAILQHHMSPAYASQRAQQQEMLKYEHEVENIERKLHHSLSSSGLRKTQSGCGLHSTGGVYSTRGSVRLPSPREEDMFSVSRDILSEPAQGCQEAGNEADEKADGSCLRLPPSAPPHRHAIRGHGGPGGEGSILVGPPVYPSIHSPECTPVPDEVQHSNCFCCL